MPVTGPAKVKVTRVALSDGAETVTEQSFEPSAKKARVAPIRIRRSLSIGDPETRLLLDNPFQRYNFVPGDGVRVEVQGVLDEDYVEVVDGFVGGITGPVGVNGKLDLIVESWNQVLDLIHLDRDYTFQGKEYVAEIAAVLLDNLLPGVSQDLEASTVTGDAEFAEGTTLRGALDHVRHALTDATGDTWEYEYGKPSTGEEFRLFTRSATSVKTIREKDLVRPVEVDRGSVFDVANRVILKGGGANEVGLQMYVVGNTNSKVYEYRLETPSDLGSASFSQDFSVASQETSPVGLFFRSDGLKMYVIGNVTDKVLEYDLGTAWDVSSSSFLQGFDFSSEDTIPQAVFFRSDGLKMYIAGFLNEKVFEYDLSEAWDVSTASFLQGFSVSAQDTALTGVFFRADGLKMYITGDDNNKVYEYDLSVAWDVSTAVFLQDFSVGSEDTVPLNVFFRSDGLKMYVIGSANDKVYEYDLSVAWDVSTAVFLQDFSVGSEDTDPRGLFFRQQLSVTVNDLTSQSKYANLVPNGILQITRLDETIKTFTMANHEANALLSRRSDVRDSVTIEFPYDSDVVEGSQVTLEAELEDSLDVTGPFDILAVEHSIGPSSRTRIQANEFDPTSTQTLRTIAAIGSDRTLA